MLQLENSSFETRKLPECHRLLGFSPFQQRSALLIFLHAGHGVGRRPLDDHRFLKNNPCRFKVAKIMIQSASSLMPEVGRLPGWHGTDPFVWESWMRELSLWRWTCHIRNAVVHRRPKATREKKHTSKTNLAHFRTATFTTVDMHQLVHRLHFAGQGCKTVCRNSDDPENRVRNLKLCRQSPLFSQWRLIDETALSRHLWLRPERTRAQVAPSCTKRISRSIGRVATKY